MKLLFVTEFFPESNAQSFTGGVESRTFQTVTRLKVSHDVAVVSRTKKLITASLASVWSRMAFMARATIEVAKRKPELVEGSNVICYLPAFFGAKIARAKAVAWYADVYGSTWFRTTAFPVALLGFALEWLSLRLPWDQVIAMSQTTKKKLIASGVDPLRITVIYGGVDSKKINQLAPETKLHQPVICTAARLVPYKRIDDVLQAFALVKQHLPEASLLIMGEGPERSKLETLAADLGVRTSVTFTGALDHLEVLKKMKQSHVFSLPSAVEGFGLVSIEAAACGLPYVSSDIPATREITQDGKGGFLYPVGDCQELADKLVLLLTDADIYVTKHRQAMQLAQDYDWQQILKKTETVYQSVLGGS